MYRIYTNDIAVERAKQSNARASEDRLGVLRNRIARAKQAKLVAIAMVAKENGDRTVEREARAKLTDLGVLSQGQPLADVAEIVQSRRESRSKEMAALTGQVEPVENAELEDALADVTA